MRAVEALETFCDIRQKRLRDGVTAEDARAARDERQDGDFAGHRRDEMGRPNAERA